MKYSASMIIAAAGLVQGLSASRPVRRGEKQAWMGYDTKPGSNLWPTEKNTLAGCSAWVMANRGDNCVTLATAGNVPLADFIEWNPVLARNCGSVKEGFSYCVDNPDYRASRPRCKCTTTVTTTTTVATAKATLAPSQFPTASGTLQCVQTDSPISEPSQIPSGGVIDDAIARACDQLVTGGNRFLGVGDPYISVISVDGTKTDFSLSIQLGGFPVENSLCKEQLGKVVGGCTTDDKTYGGCGYTDDFNLGACILPRV
ncbi:hypothetical protein TWF694_001973 [Orbilia ellipsospora]|uniref:LysM domain-containing protein n=1 Tax=Orbilia ellipsospora TaxID=2528407 RepID=A0AAV9X5E5_9PEZI